MSWRDGSNLQNTNLVPSNHDKLQPPITLTPWGSDTSSGLSGDYTYKYFLFMISEITWPLFSVSTYREF